MARSTSCPERSANPGPGRSTTTPMLPGACHSALLYPLLVRPFAAPFDVSMPDLLKVFLFGQRSSTSGSCS